MESAGGCLLSVIRQQFGRTARSPTHGTRARTRACQSVVVRPASYHIMSDPTPTTSFHTPEYPTCPAPPPTPAGSSSSSSLATSSSVIEVSSAVLFESELTKTCCDHLAFLVFYYEAMSRLTAGSVIPVNQFMSRLVVCIDLVEEIIRPHVDEEPWADFGSRSKIHGTHTFYGLRRLLKALDFQWSTPIVAITRALFRLACRVALKEFPGSFRSSRMTVFACITLVDVIREIYHFQLHRMGKPAPKLRVLQPFLNADIDPPPEFIPVPPELVNTNRSVEGRFNFNFTNTKEKRKKDFNEIMGTIESVVENEYPGQDRLLFEASSIEDNTNYNQKRRRGKKYLFGIPWWCRNNPNL